MGRNNIRVDNGDCVAFTLYAVLDPFDGWTLAYNAWRCGQPTEAISEQGTVKRLETHEVPIDVVRIVRVLLEDQLQELTDYWWDQPTLFDERPVSEDEDRGQEAR
jgi:hypothetical protein